MDGFAAMVPLEGGWSGRTFLAEVGGEHQVVRIYLPDENDALAATASLHRLVRGHLPVPDVLEVRPGDPRQDHPGLLVTRWVDGERGDVLLPRLHDDALSTLGTHVGDLLVALGGMPALAAGRFAGGDLGVEPFGGTDVDLEQHVERVLPLLAHWHPHEREGLASLAAQAEVRLAAVDRHVLVHGDLNPKNYLVDVDTLAVTALVDWEFAHAGHPFTDLGNVLRFERQPAYANAVLARYAEGRGVDPGEALSLARDADLWALVDLAGRRGNSPVAERADALLRGIAGAGDAGWTPPLTRT